VGQSTLLQGRVQVRKQVAHLVFKVVIGGDANQVDIDYGTIIGGLTNRIFQQPGAADSYSAIVGGDGNQIIGRYSFIAGGQANIAASDYNFLAGKNVSASTTGSISIGSGVNASNKLVNDTANSLYVGFNSTIPTLVVTTASGVGTFSKVGVATSTPLFRLQVGDVKANTYFSVDASGNATTSGYFIIGSTQGVSDKMGVGDLFIGDDATITDQFVLSGIDTATAGTNNDLCISAAGIVINESTGTCIVSSKKFKHDIKDLEINGLSILLGLKPSTFIRDGENITRYGFIAEDVAEVDEHLATYGIDGLPRGLDDHALIAVLVRSVQELSMKVDRLEGRLNYCQQ